MAYTFWKRYSTKGRALKEAAKLRKMGQRAKVLPFGGLNWDVLVDLPGVTEASYKQPRR